MNKTYLFSPLGGTDPISQDNCRDGSMLHICRFEKPDKVYLYFSKEIIGYEEADHRYTYCLRKLMEHQNRTFEIEEIRRPDLLNVYDFDFFYPEFMEIIGKIMGEMDETDTLILNISSGTPAMKSALAVIRTITNVKCRLVQVTTPKKGMNKHDIDGYDVSLLWDLNEDNEPGTENRCKDVFLPSLDVMKKEEIIKMHVRAYDYRAALQVAESLPEDATNGYLDMLRLAVSRMGFDIKKVNEYEKKTGYGLPVKNSQACKRFEYALNLHVKLKRGEYADFIRAITPLIVDMYEQILKIRFRFILDDYCVPEKKGQPQRYQGRSLQNNQVRSKKQPRRWSTEKLKGTDILRELDGAYTYGFKSDSTISSDHLRIIIKHYSDNAELNTLVDELRDVEEKARNIAAHEMDAFDDEKIKDLTGMSADTIMQNIRKLFGCTGYSIPERAWESYEEMNDKIIEMM